MIPELPSGYRFDGRELIWEGNGKVIANFLLVPTKAYCRKGETLPSYCDIAVVREEKCIPFQSRMELPKLTTSWWKSPPPSCCYEPGVKAPHRQMERLFHTLLGKLEPITVFRPSSLGWETLPTGEHVYATGSGVISANGYLPEERVWIPSAMKQYELETLSLASKKDMSQYFWRLYRAIPGSL